MVSILNLTRSRTTAMSVGVFVRDYLQAGRPTFKVRTLMPLVKDILITEIEKEV